MSKFTSLGIIFLTAVSTQISALGIGVDLGPFSLRLGGDINVNRKIILDNPICYAIRDHKELQMIVENEEKVDQDTRKLVVKKFTIQPYLFGIDQKGDPILRGNIVNEKVMKEVTVKEVDHDAPDNNYPKTYYSGFFSWLKGKNYDTVNMRKVSAIRVLEDSNFEVPDNVQDMYKDDDIEVICRVVK